MKIGCERTSYDDHHDDGGFANYIFNELCSFDPGCELGQDDIMT